MTSPEPRWRPVEPKASEPGVYFDGQPTPKTWSWKLPAWMTADWPEPEESGANESWWPTVAICVMAFVLVLASLQPWAWR